MNVPFTFAFWLFVSTIWFWWTAEPDSNVELVPALIVAAVTWYLLKPFLPR